MAVPTETDVLALIDEYESDTLLIEELEQKAENLQVELNDVILRGVYNLSEEEVAVIDEFLEVW